MTLEKLYKQGIELADAAFDAERKGEYVEAKCFLRAATEVLACAAFLVSKIPNSEPSRSIIYRSAASAAYHLEDYKRAKQLITLGLDGDPPGDIIEELRALLDNVQNNERL